MQYHLRVFENPVIGKFVTPLFGYTDEQDPISISSIWSWCVAINSRLDSKSGTFSDTGKWLDIELDENGNYQLNRVKLEMISSVFLHGGATVMVISGPVYDSALENTNI